MTARRTAIIGLGTLVSLGLLGIPAAQPAQPQGAPPACSLATLKGLYMFAQSGQQSVNGSLVPLAVTGKAIFYGNGAFQSLATLSVGGTIVPGDAAPGTYTINSDCTGTVTVNMTPPTPDVHSNIVVSPYGDEFFTIETDPGTVLSGTEQRVAQ